MKKNTAIFTLLFFSFLSFGQEDAWLKEKVNVQGTNENFVLLSAENIENKNWDELKHPLFWQKIMQLSPDSMLLNVASSRQIVGVTSFKTWHSYSEIQKTSIKDSLKKAFSIAPDEKINVTTGKSDFYRFDLVLESLPKGVQCFENVCVDPWYAQSILMIESPGHDQKSSVGAYGAFQLMPSVARAYGLKVNKSVDERKDFQKSAEAAAKLIQNVCIPSARSAAIKAGLIVDENAIWFRLLTLHVYHAGAGNVNAVVAKVGTVSTGEELIQKMWNTTAGGFGNCSQNYSQIALAAHIELKNYLTKKGLSFHPFI